MPEFFLGLDLGGTAVKAGIVDPTGRLLSQTSLPTEAQRADPTQVVATMVQAARNAAQAAALPLADLAAVGVVTTGILALDAGLVVQTANLPGWQNFPLRQHISQALAKPAILENDANAAAFAEFYAGVAKPSPDHPAPVTSFIMLTLGTGVGAGIIDHGHIVHGASDFAGEIGHTIIVPDGQPCPCGQHGCLETYCSASATARRATAELQHSNRLSTLRPILTQTGQITSADVAAHAQAGDPLAAAVWDQSCQFIALACLNIVRFLDPQIIALAGGMSAAGPFLLGPVTRHLHSRFWKLSPPTVQIVLATLGNNAGVIGAAGLAAQALHRHTIPPTGT